MLKLIIDEDSLDTVKHLSGFDAEIISVGDIPELPKEVPDSVIAEYAKSINYIITNDKKMVEACVAIMRPQQSVWDQKI